MRYSITTFYCLFTAFSNSFVVVHNTFHRYPRTSQQFQEGSDGDGNADRPKNLVNKETLIAAVEALKGKTESDEKPMYAMGKVMIPLSIVGSPGLDLSEVPGLLVLVSGATDNAAEVGILVGDTIVSIGAGDGTFHRDTKGLTLQETGEVLTLAATHAVERGLSDVNLEINRLIKIAYAE